MEKYQFCKIHQEQAEIISRDPNNNELIGICLNCLPLPQGVPYQSKKNVLINIENNKILMIKHFEKEKDYNINILRKLMDYLRQYKKTQVEIVDKILSQGEQEINQIEKKCLNSQNQIKEYNASIDVEQLIILFNVLQRENSLDKTIKQLRETLIQLQQQSLLLDYHKILEDLPFSTQLDLSNTENPNQLKKIYKCPKHNQMIVGADLKNSQVEAFCLNCISNQNMSFTKLDDADKIWKEYYKNSKICLEKLQNSVQMLTSQSQCIIIDKYNNIQRKLENFQFLLGLYRDSKLKKLNKFIQPHKQFGELDLTSCQQLQQLKKISQLELDDWRFLECEINLFNSHLQQKQYKFVSCLFRLNQFINHIINYQINQVSQVQIQYEYLSDINIDQDCTAIAINSQGNIFLVASISLIDVFEFNAGFPKKIQQVGWGAQLLQFMKNQTTFVSANYQTIKIWKQESVNIWKEIQILKGHTQGIQCLQINLSGHQIISGGQDKSIRFWSYNNQEWSNSQSISDLQSSVLSLILNETESKLICGLKDLIFVMEQSQKNQWLVVQKIRSNSLDGICFITDDMFSFKLLEGKLQIDKYNIQSGRFTFLKSIEVQRNIWFQDEFVKLYSDELFKQTFIKSKQLLLSYSYYFNHYIEVIKRVKNETFRVEQFVKLQYRYIQCRGIVSDDGEYLITWIKGKKKINVKQCKILLESK